MEQRLTLWRRLSALWALTATGIRPGRHVLGADDVVVLRAAQYLGAQEGANLIRHVRQVLNDPERPVLLLEGGVQIEVVSRTLTMSGRVDGMATIAELRERLRAEFESTHRVRREP